MLAITLLVQLLLTVLATATPTPANGRPAIPAALTGLIGKNITRTALNNVDGYWVFDTINNTVTGVRPMPQTSIDLIANMTSTQRSAQGAQIGCDGTFSYKGDVTKTFNNFGGWCDAGNKVSAHYSQLDPLGGSFSTAWPASSYCCNYQGYAQPCSSAEVNAAHKIINDSCPQSPGLGSNWADFYQGGWFFNPDPNKTWGVTNVKWFASVCNNI